MLCLGEFNFFLNFYFDRTALISHKCLTYAIKARSKFKKIKLTCVWQNELWNALLFLAKHTTWVTEYSNKSSVFCRIGELKLVHHWNNYFNAICDCRCAMEIKTKFNFLIQWNTLLLFRYTSCLVTTLTTLTTYPPVPGHLSYRVLPGTRSPLLPGTWSYPVVYRYPYLSGCTRYSSPR